MTEPLYSRIEPLKEIARLMKIPPGRFKQMMDKKEPGISEPIPHYPNWIYWCPKCQRNWEGEDYFDLFSQPCPDCRGKK
ncbi:hypothetical protein M0R72_11350 [Candidatus Pacearchaeota archaeon]|jgi:hypothetical protein|nr:hypothetical protein [Candidatus Pacearchaeota archaeon]